MNTLQPITSGDAKAARLADLIARQQKQRETPVVLTKQDYAEAAERLLILALKNCGGSRAAAQVLLSTYNGHSWQLNLIDLCNLDCEHYRAAIIVIRGRVELNCEPQRLIDHGDRLFDRLEKEWQAYHVKNRYQSRN